MRAPQSWPMGTASASPGASCIATTSAARRSGGGPLGSGRSACALATAGRRPGPGVGQRRQQSRSHVGRPGSVQAHRQRSLPPTTEVAGSMSPTRTCSVSSVVDVNVVPRDRRGPLPRHLIMTQPTDSTMMDAIAARHRTCRPRVVTVSGYKVPLELPRTGPRVADDVGTTRSQRGPPAMRPTVVSVPSPSGRMRNSGRASCFKWWISRSCHPRATPSTIPGRRSHAQPAPSCAAAIKSIDSTVAIDVGPRQEAERPTRTL